MSAPVDPTGVPGPPGSTAKGPITFPELAAKPVGLITKVGPKRAEAFARVGIDTVLDLVLTYPRRWVDRTREAGIAALVEGEEALVVGRVTAVSSRPTRNRRTMVTVDVADATGRMRVSFFNQPWRERQLPPGTEVALFGKAERYRGALQMTNPVVDLLGNRTGRIVAIYPASEKAGVSGWEVADAVGEALRRSGRGFADPLPPGLVDRLGLLERDAALRSIHEPQTLAERDAARTRLVFDELLRLQVALVRRKRTLEASAGGVAHRTAGPVLDAFWERLPFGLTGAQHRVIHEEIFPDLARPVPMHRLLQGDVGAGKTVVAVAALLAAVEGGHQGALMAPTEVLAEQHHAGIARLLDGLRVPARGAQGTLAGDRELQVRLLANSVGAAERRRVLAGLAAGDVDIVVGTHALLAEGVTFESLGVVVIDEQHRFGVEQRAALRAKAGGGGNDGGETGSGVADVLVMTATPIPRTAAMTVYGDLDTSVLDELPPGRTPVVTVWARDELAEAEVWDRVRDEAAAGHRAFVVCPLVEDSDRLEAASAEATLERLVAGELAGLRVGLVHGRVPAAERDAAMAALRSGELDVLVATTVIEVGVDVPVATVMVVLDAARFGIAQLHQLRGRVGRGSLPSWCYLVGDAPTPDAARRLEALVATTDGFALAEEDLDIRGEGTILGERQKGRSDLRLASLRRDRVWLERARDVAGELLGPGGETAGPAAALLEELDCLVGEDEREYLTKS